MSIFTLKDLDRIRDTVPYINGEEPRETFKEITRKLVIFGVQENMNDMLRVAKSPKGKTLLSARKRKMEEAICLQLANIAPIPGRNRLYFTWFCKDRRQDPDNITAGRKPILDALQKAGIIENDGWKQISGFIDDFVVDAKNPRVEIFFAKS